MFKFAKWILKFVFIVHYRKGIQLNGWPQNALKQRSTLQKRVMFGPMELSFGKYFPWVNKDCILKHSTINYIIKMRHTMVFCSFENVFYFETINICIPRTRDNPVFAWYMYMLFFLTDYLYHILRCFFVWILFQYDIIQLAMI